MKFLRGSWRFAKGSWNFAKGSSNFLVEVGPSLVKRMPPLWRSWNFFSVAKLELTPLEVGTSLRGSRNLPVGTLELPPGKLELPPREYRLPQRKLELPLLKLELPRGKLEFSRGIRGSGRSATRRPPSLHLFGPGSVAGGPSGPAQEGGARPGPGARPCPRPS